MRWIIRNKTTYTILNSKEYLNESLACEDIKKLGKTLSNLYLAVPIYENKKWNMILNEGLKLGDLEGIILPQFSVDLYVPGDADTDNIVIAFLIKGVPEAVYPFRNFCKYSEGVCEVDYGDSDTIPNTSIVYVEFERDKFRIENLENLIKEVSSLSNFSPDDFTMVFPTSNKHYPYSPEMLEKYFSKRSIEKNLEAQKKAIQDRTQQIQQEVEKELNFGNMGKHINPEQIKNSIDNSKNQTVNHIKSLKGTKDPEVRSLVTIPMRKIKKLKTADIPEPVKLSIIADAKRNRISKQTTWKAFDMNWARRLNVTPNKIASIRKKVYESLEENNLVNRLVEIF